MERIILETMVGEVQVGVLMGVGILRDEILALDELLEEGGEGEKEMREGDKMSLQQWIEEGEDFIVELEGMKRLIGEREAEMRYMKEVVRMYGDERVESECISEGSSSVSAEDEDGSPPPIPRRSSKRAVPIKGLE